MLSLELSPTLLFLFLFIDFKNTMLSLELTFIWQNSDEITISKTPC